MSNSLDDYLEKERRAIIYPIILSEHNNQWHQWYADEKERLTLLIGNDRIKRISHIGSTSVPGLLAKPTIDILLEITENADTEVLVEALPATEYICIRQQTVSTHDRILFLKGYNDCGFAEKVFHVHVRSLGDWDELYFRNYLVSNHEVATAYGQLKRELLKKFEHDRDGYTFAKGEFIRKHTSDARRIAGSIGLG